MLRDDVQDKLVETLARLQKAIRLKITPTWAASVSKNIVQDIKDKVARGESFDVHHAPQGDTEVALREQQEHFCCGKMRPWSQAVCGLCDTGSMTGPIDPDWTPDEVYSACVGGGNTAAALYALTGIDMNDTEVAPHTIDGVEPVVVDGFAFKDRLDDPWIGTQLRIFSVIGDGRPPCRVHIYPGIGRDGKLVKK